MIVNAKEGESQGMIVTVIRCMGDQLFLDFDNTHLTIRAWKVDALLKDNTGDMTNIVPEDQLQRIDDYDGNDVVSWDDMKGVWQPERVEEVVV